MDLGLMGSIQRGFREPSLPLFKHSQGTVAQVGMLVFGLAPGSIAVGFVSISCGVSFGLAPGIESYKIHTVCSYFGGIFPRAGSYDRLFTLHCFGACNTLVCVSPFYFLCYFLTLVQESTFVIIQCVALRIPLLRRQWHL